MGDEDLAGPEEARGRKCLVFPEVEHESPACPPYFNKQALSTTRLLRASEVFVSHTHMDHFIGFDRLLRIALGRQKALRIYGPPGLIENVAGKLRGYTWNLVDDYPFTIDVREFHSRQVRHACFRASERFLPMEGSPEI